MYFIISVLSVSVCLSVCLFVHTLIWQRPGAWMIHLHGPRSLRLRMPLRARWVWRHSLVAAPVVVVVVVSVWISADKRNSINETITITPTNTTISSSTTTTTITIAATAIVKQNNGHNYIRRCVKTRTIKASLMPNSCSSALICARARTSAGARANALSSAIQWRYRQTNKKDKQTKQTDKQTDEVSIETMHTHTHS